MEFMLLHLSGVVSFYSASGYRLEICLSFYSTDIAARLLELKGRAVKNRDMLNKCIVSRLNMTKLKHKTCYFD